MKATNNWKMIADYVSRYPKNEKVQRIIREVNTMRKEARDIAEKEANRRNKK